MMLLPAILIPMKCSSCRWKAAISSSKVLNAAGSPVAGPSGLPLTGSRPLFRASSSTLGMLK